MCGITGYFQQSNANIGSNVLEQMTHTLKHRGPDAVGFYKSEICGLGHQRLSIIDLSSLANQPMISKDGKLVMVYNGEVYNFIDLKRELEKLGCVFSSQSDTEVVLAAYEQWGERFLSKLNGFFSLAIYNKNTEELILARDRIGIKPLFYYHHNGNFAFASELKSILEYPYFKKELNQQSIKSFINFQYIPGNSSIYKNTFKLAPGFYLKVSKANFEIRKYWDLSKERNPNTLSFNENVNRTKSLLRSSIKERQISDVPLGAFLSGGIDSSLLVSILKEESENVSTYTIGFEEKEFNEASTAELISKKLGTKHHQKIITANMAKSAISLLPEIFDEPFADSSAIPTLLVSEFASKDLKVVLSGDGGDELFWGYDRYNIGLKIQGFLKYIPKPFHNLVGFTLSKLPIEKHKRFFEYLSQCIYRKDWRYFALWSFTSFTESTLNQLFGSNEKSYKEFLEITNGLEYSKPDVLPEIDIKNYLPSDILTKVDRCNMWNGLEARVPFLDHRFIEHYRSIPLEQKFQNKVPKAILKAILREYLPQKIIELPKKGFEVPIRKWLLNDLSYLIDENLSQEYLKFQGVFNPAEIERLIMIFKKGKINIDWGIWSLIMFQLWFKRWVTN